MSALIPRLVAERADPVPQHVTQPVGTDLEMIGAWPLVRGGKVAVRIDQHKVRLRTAAVDPEKEAHTHGTKW